MASNVRLLPGSPQESGKALLENAFLSAQVDLTDSAVVSILDKRTGTELLDRVDGEGRVRLTVHGTDDIVRGQSTWHLHPAQDPESPAAVFVSSLVPERPARWTLCVSLHPDECVLTLELRHQNRSLLPEPCLTGLDIDWNAPFKMIDTPGELVALYDAAHRTGLVINLEETGMVAATTEADRLQVRPLAYQADLGGRRLQEWKLRLTPISDLDDVMFVGNGLVASMTGDNLAVQTDGAVFEAKILLATADGQTLESKLDTDGPDTRQYDLRSLPSPAVGIYIRHRDKRVLLEGSLQQKMVSSTTSGSLAFPRLHPIDPTEFASLIAPGTDTPDRLFMPFTLSTGLEHQTWLALAANAVRRRDLVRADACIDKALSFNAEDGLTWWIKAAVARRRGDEETVGLALQNAHSLDPLEPVLRAEAFLSQNDNTPEANPLVASLGADPEAAADIAVLLLESGMTEEFVQFADEMFRHGDHPRLRLLMAWSLATQTRMDASAAEHLVLAARSGFHEPLWSTTERHAARALVKRFPNDEWLKRLTSTWTDV